MLEGTHGYSFATGSQWDKPRYRSRCNVRCASTHDFKKQQEHDALLEIMELLEDRLRELDAEENHSRCE